MLTTADKSASNESVDKSSERNDVLRRNPNAHTSQHAFRHLLYFFKPSSFNQNSHIANSSI